MSKYYKQKASLTQRALKKLKNCLRFLEKENTKKGFFKHFNLYVNYSMHENAVLNLISVGKVWIKTIVFNNYKNGNVSRKKYTQKMTAINQNSKYWNWL